LAATYVVILVLAAPKLGAGATVAFVVLGQILASVTIDHFGILEFPLHPLSWARFAGVALMIAGVALVKFF
jgi:transporter family-2 protein